MHALAAGVVVGVTIKRAAEGDCPTIEAFGVEILEEALIEVNRLFQTEQKERESFQSRVRELEAALQRIRDYEAVTNGDWAVMEVIPVMRKIAVTALASNSGED